nr:putative lysozyme (Lysis protein) (Muramidase) (Endolysin) (P13) [uncultured Mediterranean phage uvMED]
MTINLVDFFRYYEHTPEQQEAIALLQQAMPESLLTDEAAWVQQYRKQPEKLFSNPLDVPYDSQWTNPSGQGYRECFSSSCAMVAKFWLPELSINEYLNRRPKYGDSTDASAQIATLRSFGLDAKFVSWGTADKLKAQIDRGRPAPVGWLHTGHVSSPTGGGHYSVVIGYDDAAGQWIHHDPNGEANLVGGGYATTGSGGKSIRYSYKNWNPRWMVEGTGSGWGLDVWKP